MLSSNDCCPFTNWLTQVRAFAEAALNTLTKSGASKDGPPPPQRNVEEEIANIRAAILTLLPQELVVVSASLPNGPHTPRHPLLADIIAFVSSLTADLVHARRFSEANQWRRCIGIYLTPWFPGGADDATAFAEQVRSHFAAIDKVGMPVNASVLHLLTHLSVGQTCPGSFRRR